MNIVLCGMMGVGKSSVGIEIARMSGRRWLDTDDVITEKHGKISDIFEFYGEEYFRNIETKTIKEISGEDNLVISTGGGAVLREENVNLLKSSTCVIVYLKAETNTLLKRISPEDESRPLLSKHSEGAMRERIEELMASRASVYEGVADFVVSTDGKSVKEVAAEVLALV